MSIALHALALFVLLLPAVASVQIAVTPRTFGLGGRTRGGGGGGQRAEHLRFVATPAPRRAVAPPRVIVPPPAIKPPPPPPPPVAPLPQVATVDPTTVAGSGGAGAGPGIGGGVGAGAGPGAGSGKGPGTAGDPAARKQSAQAPEVIFSSVLDAPKNARPRHVTVVFIVGSTGEAKVASFTPTSDGSLNRRLREDFEQMTRTRWQPAQLDGVAVADTIVVPIDLP
jgi:periplasmic protein TonB